MSVRTGWPKWTMSFTVSLADRHIAGKTETETLSQERSERKVIVAWVARSFRRQNACGHTVDVGCHGCLRACKR